MDKSTLIKTIYQSVTNRFNSIPGSNPDLQRPLCNDTLNSIVAKFLEVKVLIIDEISMVGAKTLEHLDARLKQIFKCTQAFDGLSILVFGDLKQLPPVGDKWIFTVIRQIHME